MMITSSSDGGVSWQVRTPCIHPKEIASYCDGEHAGGVDTVVWDGTRFPTGMYFCRLIAGQFSETRNIVLVR